MGHFSVVHGYIDCDDDERNRARIAALPEHDTWPFLTRDLFTFPAHEHAYWEQVISFGAMYNGVERAWDVWLGKFEALLRTLDWHEAHVYLETELWGAYHYVWKPVPDSEDKPVEGSEPAEPKPEWVFSGGPRSNIRERWEASTGG